MFYIYKTTNTINGKYYIGVHKSNNIETDTYLGSGKALKNAIEKYGITNFTREILFCFDDENEAYLKESEIVDKNDPMSYNMMEGGKGGWTYVNSLDLPNPSKDPEIIKKGINTKRKNGVFESEHIKETARKNGKLAAKTLTGKKRSKEFGEKVSKGVKKYYENNDHHQKGKPLPEKHKNAISEGWTEESRKKKSEWQKERIRKNPNVVRGALGTKRTEEQREKLSKATKDLWVERKKIRGTCPHCGKEGVLHNLKRWHFENCRSKKS